MPVAIGTLLTTAGSIYAHYLARSKIQKLETLELVFRLPFLRTNVKGRDEKVGNRESKHLVQMIALQIKGFAFTSFIL